LMVKGVFVPLKTLLRTTQRRVSYRRRQRGGTPLFTGENVYAKPQGGNSKLMPTGGRKRRREGENHRQSSGNLNLKSQLKRENEDSSPPVGREAPT